MDMSDKKYGIVTGASRGLGAAIAEELAREGYDLVITYSGQQAKAEEVKARLEKEYGVRIETYKISIQNENEVAEFRKWAEENMGTDLVVLVNNAGTYCNVPADEIDTKLFCDTINVNVNGTFFKMCIRDSGMPGNAGNRGSAGIRYSYRSCSGTYDRKVYQREERKGKRRHHAGSGRKVLRRSLPAT